MRLEDFEKLCERLDSIVGVDGPDDVAAVRDDAALELMRLHDIVSKLAAVDQTIVGDDEGNHWCPLCAASIHDWNLHAPPPVHEPTCPWRLAREGLGKPWEGWNPDDTEDTTS